MRYRTKAEWAHARARTLRAQADQLRAERIPSADWRGVRRKMDGIRRLEEEAQRFARIAERLAA